MSEIPTHPSGVAGGSRGRSMRPSRVWAEEEAGGHATGGVAVVVVVARGGDATGVAGSPFESTQDKNFVGGERWFQSDKAMEKEVILSVGVGEKVIFGCSSGAEQSFTMPPNQTAV